MPIQIYIFTVDADDTIETTTIEEAVAGLESDRNIAFVYTDAIHFRDGMSWVMSAAEDDPESLLLVNQSNYYALFPRSAWSTAGDSTEDICRGYEDLDSWL